MVIASIDIKGGKVVQLRQGRDTVLERDDALALIDDFNRYGEVAIIDLDAALGSGSNDEIVKKLLRRAECRVGGGIRTVERARELVSLGAQKVIIGSAAFRTEAGFEINHSFLESLVAAIGRERIIVAIDAWEGEIVVDGWKTKTGLSLIPSAKALSKYAGDFLFTCTEREGMMQGIDLEQVRALRSALKGPLTVAGGVSTLKEIAEISSLGCDIQLGMAIYTGEIDLAEAFITALDWKKSPLLPLIAQAEDGQVLMLGFADEEAVRESFLRGKVCFHSRSRSTLWMKGETSGNTLDFISMRADCDSDALLARVRPAGPTCHTGSWSCFGPKAFNWDSLYAVIAERFKNPKPGSYTATLTDTLVREKLMEEAEEVCTADTHENKVWEVADLLYFMTVIMVKEGVNIEEVFGELDRRNKK